LFTTVAASDEKNTNSSNVLNNISLSKNIDLNDVNNVHDAEFLNNVDDAIDSNLISGVKNVSENDANIVNNVNFVSSSLSVTEKNITGKKLKFSQQTASSQNNKKNTYNKNNNKKAKLCLIDNKEKPIDLHSLATPTKSVCEYVKYIIRKTFSVEEIWGTRHNLNKIMSRIELYLQLDRNETVTVFDLVKQISIKDIPWLRVFDSTNNNNNKNNDVFFKSEKSNFIDLNNNNNNNDVYIGNKNNIDNGSGNISYNKNNDGNSNINIENYDNDNNNINYTVYNAYNKINNEDCNKIFSNTDEAKKDTLINDENCQENIKKSTTNNKNKFKKLKNNRKSSLITAIKEQFFYRFILWLFNDFINVLLSFSFYITEVEGRGFQVLYYRKPIWSLIVEKGIIFVLLFFFVITIIIIIIFVIYIKEN
jgi:hypothetical protein